MKITFNRESFIEFFAQVAAVCNQRSAVAKPILGGVLLKAGGSVTLEASDLELGLLLTLEGVTVERPGSAWLGKDKVFAALKASTSETATIELKGAKLVLTCGTTKFSLGTQNADEYPSQQKPEGHPLVVSRRSLLPTLKLASMSVEQQGSHFQLAGVRLEAEKHTLDVVSTDRRRITATSCSYRGSPAQAAAIVPIAAVRHISRLVDGDGECDLTITPNTVFVQADGATFWTRQLEGRYPNWRGIVRAPQGRRIEVPAGVLLRLTEQAAVTVDGDVRVGINYSTAGGMLVASSRDGDGDECHAEVPVSGEIDAVLMNARYVADIARALHPESPISIDVISKSKSVLFTSGDHRFVVMPIEKIK